MNKLQEITQEIAAITSVGTEKEIGNLLTVLREIERINSYTMYLEKFLKQNQVTFNDFVSYATTVLNKLQPLVEDNLSQVADKNMKELVLSYFTNTQKTLAYLQEKDTEHVNGDEPLQLHLYVIRQPKEVKYPVQQVGLGFKVDNEADTYISLLTCRVEKEQLEKVK